MTIISNFITFLTNELAAVQIHFPITNLLYLPTFANAIQIPVL